MAFNHTVERTRAGSMTITEAQPDRLVAVDLQLERGLDRLARAASTP